jgi:hypothetical protein
LKAGEKTQAHDFRVVLRRGDFPDTSGFLETRHQLNSMGEVLLKC